MLPFVGGAAGTLLASAPGSGGGDWNTARSFQVRGFTGAAADTRKVALDPAAVQRWIDEPQNNHGFVLVPTVAGKTSFMRDSTDPTATARPTLRIWLE